MNRAVGVSYRMPRLMLTCCPTGTKIPVCWIRKNGQASFYLSDPQGERGDPKTAEAAFVLVEPYSLFGPSNMAVRVHFCPACGTEVPKLVRKVKPTFHFSNADDNGVCRTCNVRYCSGEDPSRVFKGV